MSELLLSNSGLFSSVYESFKKAQLLDQTVTINLSLEQPSAPYFSIKSKRGNAGEYECRIDEMGYPTAPELSLTLVKGRVAHF